MQEMLMCFGGGATPPPPKPLPPEPPPAPPPPPPAPSDTDATKAVTEENQRVKRRFSIQQSRVTGAPIGIIGDRPLGA